MNQCKCGSYAINHDRHGRDSYPIRDDLCDVCFWRGISQQKPKPGTCKDCHFWKAFTEEEISGVGDKENKYSGNCNCKKFVDSNDQIPVPKDGLVYWDYESYSCGFATGKNFGCIHFKKRGAIK